MVLCDAACGLVETTDVRDVVCCMDICWVMFAEDMFNGLVFVRHVLCVCVSFCFVVHDPGCGIVGSIC